VMEQCRVRAKKAGQILESAEELWHYFIASCKANLHIILCFSPIGEAFRERLRQFPSLVNCCTIDWFREWPNDALEAVASKILADVDVPAEERQKLLVMCKSFHKGVGELSEEYLAKEGRHNYVTPTSYLELLNMFTSLLAKQREAVSSAKRRYEVGLEKLAFTADAVRDMQDELTALKPNLIKTVAETEELMEKVQREKVEVVEPKKAAVDEEVAEAAKKGEAAGAVKKECEDLLAEAIPYVEEFEQAQERLGPGRFRLELALGGARVDDGSETTLPDKIKGLSLIAKEIMDRGGHTYVSGLRGMLKPCAAALDEFIDTKALKKEGRYHAEVY